jgi:hypothetical protein
VDGAPSSVGASVAGSESGSVTAEVSGAADDGVAADDELAAGTFDEAGTSDDSASSPQALANTSVATTNADQPADRFDLLIVVRFLTCSGLSFVWEGAVSG